MKIGVVGPIWLNIPPPGYGETEEVVYDLVNGLAEKGHDVTLFGPKTAKVNATVFPTVDVPLRENAIDWTNLLYVLYHITEAFDRRSQFDILHIHLNKSQDYIALPLSVYSSTPVVFTLHFKLPTLEGEKDRYIVLKKYDQLPFTSISDSQRKSIDLCYVKNGETGFLVKNLSEMVQRIQEVGKIQRKACRKNIEERFTVTTMVSGYEDAYRVVRKHWQEFVKACRKTIEQA